MRSNIIRASKVKKNAIVPIHLGHDGIFSYGEDNDLPLLLIDAVDNSGTARSCVDKLNKFILADGLVDEVLSKVKANNKQNFDQFVGSLIPNISYFKGVAFRALCNNSGIPVKFFNVPINELRKSKGGSFVWNSDFGTNDYRKINDIWLDEFDPNESPQSRRMRMLKQVNKYGVQYGDIVYVFEPRVGRHGNVYPIPDYFSGIEDLESDAALQRLERRNITKGFRTPMVVSTGPLDNIIKDQDGKTQKKKFNETMKRFTGEDAASILHLEGGTEELKPKVYTINIAEILDQTDKSRDRVGRAVCRHFNVSPVLVGFATAGQLGNNEELKNTIDLMQLTVTSYQNMISDAMNMVMPEKNWELTSLNLFEIAAQEATSNPPPTV